MHPKAKLMATEGALRRAFAAFDEDGSGYLTKSEFLAILTRQTGSPIIEESDADELIAAMDSDGDGRVSLEEFVENWSAQALVRLPADAIEQNEVIFATVDNGIVSAVHGEGPGRTYDIVDADVDSMHRGVPASNIYDDPLANGCRPPHMLEVGDKCAAEVVDKYAMRRAGHSMPLPGGWESLYKSSGQGEERRLQIHVKRADGGADARPYEARIAELRAANSAKPDAERDAIAEVEGVLAILREAEEAGVQKIAAGSGAAAALSIGGWIRDMESNIRIQKEIAAS